MYIFFRNVKFETYFLERCQIYRGNMNCRKYQFNIIIRRTGKFNFAGEVLMQQIVIYGRLQRQLYTQQYLT